MPRLGATSRTALQAVSSSSTAATRRHADGDHPARRRPARSVRTADDDFGSSPQSGDFNRDGRADLAIGVPGRELVAVLYGAAGGHPERPPGHPVGPRARSGRRPLRPAARRRRLQRRRVRRPRRRRSRRGPTDAGLGRHRAPLRRPGRPHRRADRARSGGPTTATSNFGSRLRTGHVNGDRHARPRRGRARPCRTGRRGTSRSAAAPRTARAAASRSTTPAPSSVAVADVTGDGIEDIVQGDHIEIPTAAARSGSGAAGRAGPPTQPTDDHAGAGRASTATTRSATRSGSPSTPATSTTTASPTWSSARRARTPKPASVIGDPRRPPGYALTGGTAFTARAPAIPGDPVAGENFGWSLAIVRLPGDDRPDLMVTARGADGSTTRSCSWRAGRARSPRTRPTVSRLRLGDCRAGAADRRDPHCPRSCRLSSVVM